MSEDIYRGWRSSSVDHLGGQRLMIHPQESLFMIGSD